MPLLDKIRQFLQETWETFGKLDVPQKVAVVSLVAFLVCSVITSTALTFVLLGAGVVGFWLAISVISQTEFFSSTLILKYLPTLVDPLKPGGKKAAQNRATSTITNVDQTSAKSQVLQECDRNQQLSVNYNIQKLIEYILKDFVFSWYSTISKDDDVSDEIEQHLYRLSKQVSLRLREIDPVRLLCVILELFRLHVHRYTRARTSLRRIARHGKEVDSLSLVASYETFAILHPAVQSESTELDYLRRCVDILQRVLLPQEMVQCKATHVLLNEILSVNVMQSLVDLISDPYTVNEIIFLILSDDDNDDEMASSHPHSSTPSVTASGSYETSQIKFEKGQSETDFASESLVDNPPPYLVAVGETCVEQSKVKLDHDITKQACDYQSQSDNTSVKPENSTDPISDYRAADLDSTYQQEMGDKDRQKAKDKGHGIPDTDEVLGKLTDVCASKARVDKSSVQPGKTMDDAKPKEKSHSSFACTSDQTKLKHSSDKRDELTSQTSEEHLDQDTKIYHRPSELVRKRSGGGVRMSYFQKLGISSGSKQSNDLHGEGQQVHLGGEPSISKHLEKKLSNLSPKLASQDVSPQQSPKKEENTSPPSSTSKTRFTFSIPFTSLGPSLSLSKPAVQTKAQVVEQEPESNSSENAVENVDNLRFVPIPTTALGPSFPDLKLGSKGKEIEWSEGQLSRSSSSSSFASMTYEEDQQNIPFEEIDFQFAYGSDDRVAKGETKEIKHVQEQVKEIKPVESDKSITFRSEENVEPKSKTFQGETHLYSLSKKSSEKSLKTKDEMLVQQSGKVVKGVKSASEEQTPLKKFSSKREDLRVSATPEEQGLLAAIPAMPVNLHSPPQSADSYSKEKDTTFRPIEPVSTSGSTTNENKQPSLPGSPTKRDGRPSLTRSRTTPALLGASGMARTQEVARSEVRLLEAKLGRFHISSVRIPRIELTKDRSGKEYVLYCVEYDVTSQGITSKMTATAGAMPTGVVRRTVKRRHREFVNLHCRLEENIRLRPLLRGIKDPPRRLSVGLAFGAVSKTVYEHRKISLEHYLQQLLNHPLLGHSEEIAEFLALGGDAHIEFVKKRTDIAPKIDQFLQWAVPSFVSTLKTAVPRAVVDLGTGPTTLALSPPVSPKSQRRRKSRDANALIGRDGAMSPPPMDNLDMEWVHKNFKVQRRKSTRIQSATHIFLQDQRDATKPPTNKTQTAYLNKPLNLGPRFEGDGCDASELVGDKVKSPQSLPMEKIELLDKIMALLTEAIHVQGQPSWILDERLQKGVCVVLGKPLDRWIQSQIKSLVSEQWCAYYLTLIQDALWPNGQLIESKITHTKEEKQKMRKNALECLVDIPPDFISHIIGQTKWRTGMEVMLDSLQDPQLNRHLVFTLLDLLLEAITTELTDPDFQDTVLNAHANYPS